MRVITTFSHRRTCAARVTVVGSVCLLLYILYTSRVFVRLTTYSTGNEGQNFVRFSSVAKLERFKHCTANAQSGIFIAAEKLHAVIMLIRQVPLALCILKAQEVTTKGVYRLPHAIYYCSQPVSDFSRETTTKEPSPSIQSSKFIVHLALPVRDGTNNEQK